VTAVTLSDLELALLGNGIIPSVGQTGICFDNAAAESWNATFKKELIHLHAWKNVEHVRPIPGALGV
jgi:transposase InsO family protein